MIDQETTATAADPFCTMQLKMPDGTVHRLYLADLVDLRLRRLYQRERAIASRVMENDQIGAMEWAAGVDISVGASFDDVVVTAERTDAERFAYLTDDIANRDHRERRNDLLVSMATHSISASRADIDAAIAETGWRWDGFVARTPDDARDAARYRFIRRAEPDLSSEEEEALAILWTHINKKGCWTAKMDRMIDEAMRDADEFA